MYVCAHALCVCVFMCEYVCVYAGEYTDNARCTTQQKNKVRSKCDIVFWYLLVTCLRCDVIFTEGHTVRPQLPA